MADAAGMACRRSTRLHPHTHASEAEAEAEAEAGDGVTRRRSPRLHPQIYATDEVAGRRSPRLHPQIYATDEVAGGRSPRLLPRDEGDRVARRRTARLRPQVHTSDEASGVPRRSRRRLRGISPAALSSPLEDDDLLWEILLRLPPQPSSLARASAVCKRWRCAVTDPRFHREFCAHHGKPPLLGLFDYSGDGVVFIPVLNSPDRIPPQRFNLNIDNGKGSGVRLLGCRHGRVLLESRLQREFIVIAPITGEEHRVPVPPKFKRGCYLDGAVLCAAADHDHVHGSCHSSQFKVVLLSTSSYRSGPQPIFACVYSSETGIWGELISTPAPFQIHGILSKGSLIGNAIYWLCNPQDYILEFDLDGHSLALSTTLPIIYDVRHNYNSREIIQIVDGAVGLAILSHYYHNIQIWQRKVNYQGVTEWVPCKTIDMHKIRGLPRVERSGLLFRLRYAEDTDDIIIYVGCSVYLVHLNSMESRKLCETCHVDTYQPFKSFYMPGTAIAPGRDGAEMLHET